MENISLTFQLLSKIAGNFIFNPIAIFIILWFTIGITTWFIIQKRIQ